MRISLSFSARRWVAVQVAAQAVEVDAHSLIRFVVRTAIDHIGGRGPQRSVEANLFVAHSFAEPGGEQQMAQAGLRIVDRLRVLAGLLCWLEGRDVMSEPEARAPFVELLAGDLPIQEAVVVGVPEGLQAVNTG